jgi:Thioredoxin domain
MKVEILGDGCSQCKALKVKVRQAVDELGLRAEICSVMDPERIAELHALSLPQLVINGQAVPLRGPASVAGIKEALAKSKY